MIGRKVSKKDIEILDELQTRYSSNVKIDFDLVNEPCIFYNFYGSWNIVYKLSKNGNYSRSRRYYVLQADEAIQSFIQKETKTRYEQEKKDQEEFLKQRQKFIKRGFKDEHK